MARTSSLGPGVLVPPWVAWVAAAVVALFQAVNLDLLAGWAAVAASLAALAAIALSLRARAVGVAVVLGLAAAVLNGLVPETSISAHLALLWLPFAVALSLGPRWAAALVAAQVAVELTLGAATDALTPLQLIAHGAVLLVLYGLSTLAGSLLRRYGFLAKHREAELKARNELFRRALSRELHDTAVHATTTMVMRANQALLREGIDQQTRQDLQFIADTGREATQTLRQMLSALRESDHLPEAPSADAAWVKARLRSNRARLEQAGFSVRMTTELPLTDVAPPILATVGRIVTEVVNNVLRHAAPGTEVSILIENTGSAVELMCSNVAGATADPEPERTRLGVVGMTELAESVGGTVTAQAVGGFWLTRVTLPARPSPA